MQTIQHAHVPYKISDTLEAHENETDFHATQNGIENVNYTDISYGKASHDYWSQKEHITNN